MIKGIVWSVLLSVPVSIGCGLLVPVIQKWLRRRGKTKVVERLQETEDKYKQVLVFLAKPFYLTQYLIVYGAFVTLSMFTMLFGLLFSLHGFTIHISHPSDAFYTLYPVLGRVEAEAYRLIGWAMLFYGSWQASKSIETMIDAWSRTNHFESYERTVPENIRMKYQEVLDAINRGTAGAFTCFHAQRKVMNVPSISAWY